MDPRQSAQGALCPREGGASPRRRQPESLCAALPGHWPGDPAGGRPHFLLRPSGWAPSFPAAAQWVGALASCRAEPSLVLLPGVTPGGPTPTERADTGARPRSHSWSGPPGFSPPPMRGSPSLPPPAPTHQTWSRHVTRALTGLRGGQDVRGSRCTHVTGRRHGRGAAACGAGPGGTCASTSHHQARPCEDDPLALDPGLWVKTLPPLALGKTPDSGLATEKHKSIPLHLDMNTGEARTWAGPQATVQRSLGTLAKSRSSLRCL